MHNKLPAILLLLLCVNTFAQSQTRWCGTDERIKQLISQDPSLQKDLDKFLNQLNQYDNQYQKRHLSQDPTSDPGESNAVIYIPVVFHIVHNGDPVGTGENISDAQVISQIEALNRDFNALDPDAANIPDAFKPLQANCRFRFCLARFDPNGNPTTGIIRHQFPNATWDSEDDIDNILKPATIWDRNRYLNIWSVRMGGDLTTNGILAYSSFPFFGNANADGVVARFNTIGTVGTLMTGANKGKTITHEVGHWLGLLHTWGLGPGCGDQGDFVQDTPDQDDANFNCPNFPKVSCASSAPNGDMFMNYMDYTTDACRNMFTLGQLNNMMGIINGFRNSLNSAATQCFYNVDVSALKMNLPADTVCSLSFKPSFVMKNEGVATLQTVTVYYEIDNSGVQIYNWTGNLPMQQETNVFLPTITLAPGNYTLYINLANPNGQADGVPTNNELTTNFHVYSGDNPIQPPLSENFEGGFPASGWTVENPNNDVTWGLDNYSAYGNGYGCASIDNYSYGSNPNKKRDAIISPSVDLSSTPYPELSFDVAYARRNSTRFDSLIVYYSLNCGKTWYRLWGRGGSNLATSADISTPFYPGNNEWQTVKIPLLMLSGFGKVSFKFENVTGWGNYLYLDNILVKNNPSLQAPALSENVAAVFPNPCSTHCNIRLPENLTPKHAEIYDVTGRLITHEKFLVNNTLLNASDLKEGVYLLRIYTDRQTFTSKLIIAR
ncbi:MAG: M43 family zinc metalloprotease [Chitinophagales bacterium]|nr:M43 family zinc metalloprotease [Chitinophagales bacterium]MDW8419713.1 M43 family zinc metalloprotease [Chitinophagales bacterium]